MKNKKVLALLLALPLIVTGCGNNKSSGGIKIKFWHTFGQTIVDGLKVKINDFKKLVKENNGVDLDIELAYQGSYDDIAKKIADSYSVDNKPTIAVAYPDNVADYLEIGKSAGEQFVVNLEPYMNNSEYGFGKEAWLGDKYGAEDFVEDFLAEGSRYAQEGTYSLPYMKSTEIMFYNMDLLVKVMKDYKPEFGNSKTKIADYMAKITWDQFIDLAQYIATNKASISKGIEVPFAYDSDANLIISKIFQEKVPYTAINNGQASIEFGKTGNIEKVTSILESLNDNFKAGLFTTKGVRGTYGSDFFTGEKCVFSIGSSGGSGYNFPQADAFELGVCRVPASNNNPVYVSQGPTLALFNNSSLSKDLNDQTKLYAWKFIKYITNGDVNADLCINGSEGYIPVRYSAYESKVFTEFMEVGENYAKCFEVVVNDVNTNCSYLVSDAFKGSAALRDECGTMLTAAIQASDKANIPGLISKAIQNASLKM